MYFKLIFPPPQFNFVFLAPFGLNHKKANRRLTPQEQRPLCTAYAFSMNWCLL